MNIKKRLSKLEESTVKSTPSKAHIVQVMPGQSAEDALNEFKENHNVEPEDEFTIFEFVEPGRGEA